MKKTGLKTRVRVADLRSYGLKKKRLEALVWQCTQKNCGILDTHGQDTDIVLIEKEASVFLTYTSPSDVDKILLQYVKNGYWLNWQQKRHLSPGGGQLEGDIWLEPATGFVTENCPKVRVSGLNTSHTQLMHLIRISLARKRAK